MSLNDKNKLNDGVISLGEIGIWSEKREKYDDYFVFSSIRNPWDKVVSAWKYCSTTKHRTLIHVLENLPSKAGKTKEERHDYRHLVRSQSELLVDENGQLVCDLLIRFEELQCGFDEVCRKIGMKKTVLPVINRTDHDDYRRYYDNQTHDLVAQLFKDDIDLFGYTFDSG